MSRVQLYRAGKYECTVPAVYTGFWDEEAWIRWIDTNGRWLE